MLSPGKYHLEVPKSLAANLEYRSRILAAVTTPSEAEAFRRMCATDILFYINACVWQFNPNKPGDEVGPFITWDFQDEVILTLLACVHEGKDVVMEKSREMGASWICLIVFDWLARFHRNKTLLMISRSREAVDSSVQTSLFWKLRFVDAYLPKWLRGETRFKEMHCRYEHTNSDIMAEASTGKAGVGGRFTAIFADEFSQIREAAQVISRTSDSTRCRIFNGTHLGTGTPFNDLCKRLDIRKIRMHWTQHPDKVAGLYRSSSPVEVFDKKYEFAPTFNFVQDGTPAGGPRPGIRSPWYDEQCKRKHSSRDVAMDLDINPEGSVTQFFDPLIIRNLQETYAIEPLWTGDVIFNRLNGEEPELIPSPTGLIKLWFKPRQFRDQLQIPLGTYAAGADIATGTGATPSCLSIVRARGDGAGQKLLEYANATISPDDFAILVVALCRLFCDHHGDGALLAWESAGPGKRFGIKVVESGYRNFHRDRSIFDERAKTSSKPGWYPTVATKRAMLEAYRAALFQREFENRSRDALYQCLQFEYEASGKVSHSEEDMDDPSGATVNHGDLVIADGLACKMMQVLWVDQPNAPKEEDLPPMVGSLAWRRQLAYNADRSNRSMWG